MKLVAAGTMLLFSFVLLLGDNEAGEKKPKYTIPQVMAKAHAGKAAIMKKVAAGEASDEEKMTLVDLYTALSENEPPQGDAKAWKEKTETLVKAAKAAAKGDEKAAKSLTKLANCTACHKAHK